VHPWRLTSTTDLTFRHVFYNDIVPTLQHLIIGVGRFDHVGAEYRYHPQHGLKKCDEDGFGFKSGRSTQVHSIAVTAPVGALDGLLVNFFRGHLKMPWSLLDHSPSGYMAG